MKISNGILILVFLSAAYGHAADPQAVGCDVYDAATGAKLNEDAGRIVGGECQVGVNTNGISSSSAQLIIRVTLDNGVSLKTLEEKAAGEFLAGKTEVTSAAAASPSGMLAYYQGLAAGGSDCLSQSGASALPAKCLEALRFQSLQEVVNNLESDTSTAGQSMNAMASMMRGFLKTGGADGMKDPLEFLKRLNNGDSSALSRGSDLSRLGGETIDTNTLKSNFLLMHQLGQIAGAVFQDRDVREKFGEDAVYKQKYFEFFKTLQSSDQAAKVAAVGANTLKSFFKNGDSFKATNLTAARELFLKEADSNFSGFKDDTKTQALFKTLAGTNYNGKTVDEIKKGIHFISGYVDSVSDPRFISENAGQVARFIEGHFDTMDPAKMDRQYFDAIHQSLMQQCHGGYSNLYPAPSYDSKNMPAVVAFSPANGAAHLDPRSSLRITLDREIDPASVSTDNFLVHCMRGWISGRVFSMPGVRWVDWTPNSLLPAGQICYAKVVGLRGVDMASTTIPSVTWSWTVDVSLFKVDSIFPKDGADHVPPNSQIRIQFNAPLDRSTLEKAVTIRNCRVDGTFVTPPNGREIRFFPKTNYQAINQVNGQVIHSKKEGCQIEMASSLRDIFGRSLGAVDPVSFYLDRTRDTQAPDFGGLSGIVADADSTSLTLYWNSTAVDDRDGPVFYDAFCAAGSGKEDFSEPTATTSINGTNMHLYDLNPDQRYCCVVRARDLAGNSDLNHQEVCAPTLASPPLSFFAYPEKNRGQITLTWSMVPNALSYRVYLRKGNVGWNVIAQTPNLYYLVSNLESGAYYSFIVTAVTPNGEGGSNIIAFFKAP